MVLVPALPILPGTGREDSMKGNISDMEHVCDGAWLSVY